jgi:autotransporter-associated beta strand protein
MNRFAALIAASLFLAMAISTASGQTTLYWDDNGADPGAKGGDGFADGTWDTSSPQWNTNVDGTGTPGVWTDGNHAVFSAGNDVTNDPVSGGAIITITPPQSPLSVTFEEGFYELMGAGGLTMGTNPITIKQGAIVSIPNQNVITAALGQVVTFDGGTIRNHIVGVGSSFYNAGAATRWELTANGGTVNAPNGGSATTDNINGGYSIMQYGSVASPSIVACTTGTVSCTLTKTGFGEFRASKNWTMTAVDVQQGLYRISNSTTNGGESGFGVPTGTVTVAGGAVANSTNGAALGTTAILTDDVDGVGSSPATRSFVLSGVGDTPDSMIVLNANWHIRGNISGAGGLMLNGWSRNDAGGVPNIIGSELSELRLSGSNTYGGKTTINFGVVVASGGAAIPNTSAVEFSARSLWGIDAAPEANKRTYNTATLRVDASETVGSLAGGNATRGVVNINGAAVELTTGADNSTSTFSGSITGAGGLSKTGTGTFTMDGAKSYTGDTKVLGGTLSTNSASLANAADVYLSTGAILNLNFSGTDTIDQLFINGAAQATGIWGGTGSGAANISPLLSGSGTLTVTTGAVAGVPGDYNNNGTVDAADYVVWRNGGPLQNEVAGTTPGSVTAEDYDAWRARFGNNSGSGSGQSAAVPEPTSILLVFAGVFGLMFMGRRGR